MSTPPFTAMPDGVAVIGPPGGPALLAEPAQPAGNVLFIPGFIGSKEDFIGVLAPLADLGWRVAAVDLPGQNGNPGLGPRGSHTLAAMGGAVSAAIDWFSPEEPVHLVGHSMGGLMSREVVLSSTDRLASWTALCSGRGALPVEAHATLAEFRAALDAGVPLSALWARKEAIDRAGGWAPPSDEVGAFMAQRFCANDRAGLADLIDGLLTAPDRTVEVAEVLAATGLPAAVITGELDDAWPVTEQEQMAADLHVPWHLLAGVGHSPHAEDPAMAVAVLHDVLTGSRAGG